MILQNMIAISYYILMLNHNFPIQFLFAKCIHTKLHNEPFLQYFYFLLKNQSLKKQALLPPASSFGKLRVSFQKFSKNTRRWKHSFQQKRPLIPRSNQRKNFQALFCPLSN